MKIAGGDAQCGDDPAPFRPGDAVVYAPSAHTRGWEANGSFRNLVPGQTYRVATIREDRWIVLEGFEDAVEGGLYWTNFTRAAV